MTDLTDEGRRIVTDMAVRYGLSTQAVEEMARAVSRGGGTMAQFNIPELGGSGQWMAGGMTMVGDMFNHGLKAQVDNLCADLSAALASSTLFRMARPGDTAGSTGAAWWPTELGAPSSSGGQNAVRYAYFPAAARLAVDRGDGRVILLDTEDHQIGGFGQQQSGPGDPFEGITFSSHRGQFPLSALRVVGAPPDAAAQDPAPTAPAQSSGAPTSTPSEPAPVEARFQGEPPVPPQAPLHGHTERQQAPAQQEAGPFAASGTAAAAATPADAAGTADVLNTLERLGGLHAAGILTDEEFNAKKTELLSRL